jgi:hypothetical protein
MESASTKEVPVRADRFALTVAIVSLLVLTLTPLNATAQSIIGFTLINADTNQPIAGFDPLPEGAVIDFTKLPTRRLNIRANTWPSVVGSVRFGLDSIASYTVESVAPYALAGDTAGDYFPWTPTLGTHAVTATPYSGTGASGVPGAAVRRTFHVVESTTQPAPTPTQPAPTQPAPTQPAPTQPAPTTTTTSSLAVAGVTLVSAATGAVIPGYDPIPDGATLNLATLPAGGVGIRANTSPSLVGSVVFGFNGNMAYRTENTAPYSLHGDTNGVYTPWNPQPGTYEVAATAYSGTGATGSKSAMLVRRFTVQQSTTTSPSPAPAPAPAPGAAPAQLAGELRTWHRVTLTFDGPWTNEDAWPNPFRDYRLNVTFINGTRRYVVPGYYAADGNAAETSARAGGKWRVHFVPDSTGTWTYTASFRTGVDVAMSLDPVAGAPTSFDGSAGSFFVQATNKTGRDHRAKGRLQYVGRHHLRFAGTGDYFLKGGADSPENFLAYWEFDGTFDAGGVSGGILHRYGGHVFDWRAGDPTWQGGKGKGIIGALNYLAGVGMNSVYFLTYNTDGGDGGDTWPWTIHTVRDRYDVSKLEQWEIVFSHMDRLGIMLHLVTQEEENDQTLDGGFLGPVRKLYYRELIARFGHHLAMQWNLGEENSNTSAQRKSFADYIRAVDPYDHPIAFHALWNQAEMNYADTFGYQSFEAASVHGDAINYNQNAINLRRSSWQAGRPWAVYGDEQTPAVASNMSNISQLRKTALWGNLMGGGAGVEWYFGYQGSFGDVQSDDWRVAQPLWDQTRHALSFFDAYLPYELMEPRNDLPWGVSGALALAYGNQLYAVYLPAGGTPWFNVGGVAGTYDVYWYSPRTGGGLRFGTVTSVSGSGFRFLGGPPSEAADDWVILVSRRP